MTVEAHVALDLTIPLKNSMNASTSLSMNGKFPMI